MGQLAGKVAVVTGGSNGIGRAIAELFVAEGARVVIADIAVEAGEALAAALGDAAMFHRIDVSEPADVSALVAIAADRFGALDIMVNNAGISCAAFPDFTDDTLADFDRVMHVNLRAAMIGTRDAARHMKDHGGGVILNMASIAGTVAGFGMMTYRASKAGLIHFSKSAAIDLACHGIRVNCIVPGHVRTTLSSFEQSGVASETAARIEKAVDAAYLSNQLIKRRGDPIDVARAALYLASDHARQLTGVVLPVEAGVSVGDPVNHLREILEARAAAMEA